MLMNKQLLNKIHKQYGITVAMIYWNGVGKRRSVRYYKKNRARLNRRVKVIKKRRNGLHERAMTLGVWYNRSPTERFVISASVGVLSGIAVL